MRLPLILRPTSCRSCRCWRDNVSNQDTHALSFIRNISILAWVLSMNFILKSPIPTDLQIQGCFDLADSGSQARSVVCRDAEEYHI